GVPRRPPKLCACRERRLLNVAPPGTIERVARGYPSSRKAGGGAQDDLLLLAALTRRSRKNRRRPPRRRRLLIAIGVVVAAIAAAIAGLAFGGSALLDSTC